LITKENYLRKYEDFLEGIDLVSYAKLRKIKTVEQDLPKSLNPLPLIYRFYWEEKDFLSYEDFFKTYWEGNLHAVMEFVRKYFYGCSLQFVEEGFKARIYRTWISLLTQFHFQYLWTELFSERYPLEASADLDLAGIDSRIFIGDKSVGVQIKKVSYRREASQRRFTKRQRRLVSVICEVPYLVIDIEEVNKKLNSKRTKEETKAKLMALFSFFEENFKVLSNGFVIFKKNYLERIKEVLLYVVNSQDKEFIPYTYFMAEAL